MDSPSGHRSSEEDVDACVAGCPLPSEKAAIPGANGWEQDTQVFFVFTSQFGALSSMTLTSTPKHILPWRLTGILSSSNCVSGGENDVGRTPNLERSLQFNPAPSCTGWCAPELLLLKNGYDNRRQFLKLKGDTSRETCL